MRRLLVTLVVAAAGLLFVPPVTAAPVPKSIKGPGTIYVWNNSQPPTIQIFTPDGESIKSVTLGAKEKCRILDVSPGGRFVVVKTWNEKLKPLPAFRCKCAPEQIRLLELDRADGELPPPVAEGWYSVVRWSADGRTAYVSAFADDAMSPVVDALPETETIAYDTKTGGTTRVELPRRHRLMDASADGRTFLTSRAFRTRTQGWECISHVVQGTDDRPLSDSSELYATTFHADGKRVFAGRFPDKGDPEPLLLDLESGKETRLGWQAQLKKRVGEAATAWRLSPDNTRVAVSWHEVLEKPADWNQRGDCWQFRLGVCDLNGDKFKTLYAPKPKTTDEHWKLNVEGFAWR